MDLKIFGNTVKVYPLNRVFPALSQYYIDVEGAVYSTKGKNPRKFVGARASSGGRYYTLNGRSWKSDDLLMGAKLKADFNTEIGTVKIEDVKPQWPFDQLIDNSSSMKDRVHASTVEAGLKGKGWVIAQVAVHDGEQFLMFGSKPKIHMTPSSVNAELTRLATAKPGTKYVGFKVDRTLVAGGLSWE